MKVDVFDLSGKAVEKMQLPKVFDEPVRGDLVKRAVLSTQSKERQPYGTNPMAGKRTPAHYHGVRHERYSMMGKEMARMPRLHGKLSPHLMWRAKFAPQVTGGREALPPLAEKVWSQKINDKENKKAVRSAIAATACVDIVRKMGHKFDSKELPIIIEDKIQEIKKSKDLVKLMETLGLGKEMIRVAERNIRAGRGKSRGRKYKKKIGPLIVISEDKGISRAARNLPGFNVCKVSNLSAVSLAHGVEPGRLTIFSKSSIVKLGG